MLVSSLFFIGQHNYIGAGIGLLCIAASAVPVFIINSMVTKSAINSGITLAVFLILVFSNPSAINFNLAHIALILFAWGEFYNLKGDNFKALFLLSFAAIFLEQLMWIVPVMLLVNTVGKSDLPRTFIVNIGAVLMPLLYIVVFRHLMYRDSVEYINEFAGKMIDVYSPVLSLSFTNIFYIVVVGIMSIHAMFHVTVRNTQNNIATGEVLTNELISSVLLFVLFVLFWGNSDVSINIILAFPMSIVLSNLYTTNLSSAYSKIELILFVCAAFLMRLDLFI